MQRKIFGFIVVVLAISLSAFTTHAPKKEAKKFGTYYWFLLNPVSGAPLTASHLVYQSGDPYYCSFIGMGGYCVGAYGSYTQDQWGYHAAGFLAVQHFYNE